jgi:hypothetical protein
MSWATCSVYKSQGGRVPIPYAKRRETVKEECSFLKKRTKKLLFLCVRCLRVRDKLSKVFCFFFYEKKAFLAVTASRRPGT